MRLVRFGRHIINMSAVLEAAFSSDYSRVTFFLAGPDTDHNGPHQTFISGADVLAFEQWLHDNCDDALMPMLPVFPMAPAPAITVATSEDDDGHNIFPPL